MSQQKIITVEEFEEIVQQQPKVLIFKASTTCNISQDAFVEYNTYMSKNEELPSYYLYVQEARPLSNHIAEKYGVRHQSPQVLYIQNGEVTWNESHWRITVDSLTKHIG
jgi:bacillithiol system protein YtxJ